MLLPELLLLGGAIAANNTAVALALGALGQYRWRGRIIITFGIFEFGVPLIGITLGRTTAYWIEQEAVWVGALMLALLGGWILATSFRQEDADDAMTSRITTWTGLVVLAAGLSLDNLLIGFSLGLGTVDALTVATTICIFSVVFTWIGLYVGHVVDATFRHYLTAIAGVLLLILAALKVMQWV